MTLDPTGPRAKAERGREHLNALYGELPTFFEPYTKREPVYHSFDGTWHTVNLRPVIEKLPLRWSLICGDAIHNLRSALDHLVRELVLAGDGKPGKWNSFPIYTDSEDFDRDVRFRKKNRGWGPLEGIDPGGQAWAAIEQAQPYYSGHPPGDPLAMLKTLDDMDKHRTLIVHMLFPAEQDISDLIGWHPAGELLEHRISNVPLSLEHETEILRLRFSDAWPDPQVSMKDGLAVEPAFGNGIIQLVPESLSFIYHHVSDLIDDFA